MDSNDRPALVAQCRALERALERQLRILHAIGVSSPDFTYVFDRNQRFIYVSPPLLALWGKTLDEATGKNFEELGYPPELVALHKQQLDGVLLGRTVSGANSYVNSSGRKGHYEYTFVPVFGDDGQVETIVGTTRDVTERLRVEQERANALLRLKESEQQFRHFADAMPQLAWIARGDGFIIWYNRRWYEYTGTSPARMEGWGWQDVHHPAELPRVVGAWRASIQTGDPFEMTFPLRAADGGYRAFLTRVIPVKNSRGTVIRWFGTNTDVETERQIIRERDAALAATNRAIEVRDEFLSVGSHELKTPLAALLLHIDSLCHPRAVESPPVRLSDRLKKASQAGHRLARLIDELLDVSRVAAAGLRLEAQAMDLSALVREVCARYESKAPGGIDLSADQPTHGQWDPLRVEQVASNLIDNAVKYGDGKPISVAVRREGGKAILKVADQGIGISAAERPFIFERFARGSRAKNYGGFGLGLWIVRQVVNATGGTVEMDSAEGTGTTVTVTLPIEPRRA